MRRLSSIYATILCTLLVGGILAIVVCSYVKSADALIFAGTGVLLSFVLAPAVHEWGHICVGKLQDMSLQYTKFFCFSLRRKRGKLALSFASPFAMEQTQMIPNSMGNMLRRAYLYTAGGILFSGLFAVTVLFFAILSSCLAWSVAYLFWGLFPYVGYIFLLNAVPFCYVGGKTDCLIMQGIRRGEREEFVMLCAMEIFGGLAEGKSFSDLDERLFDTPVIAEDEPMYAVITDLKYRYALEKEDYERASSEINRLATASPYLSDRETEMVAMELLYMHTLAGDRDLAEKTKVICEERLQEETVEAKRVLASYFAMIGDRERTLTCKKQAEALLGKADLKGKGKAESILLARI